MFTPMCDYVTATATNFLFSSKQQRGSLLVSVSCQTRTSNEGLQRAETVEYL